MTLRLLFINLLLLLCLQAHAQTFPIQGNVMLSPPYSPYLTDLTAPGAQRLMLTVRVNDPTLSDYTCKLRLTIEGVGITLRTKASFFPQAITLQGGGIPQIFYGEDLMDYFNPSNLDFAGITRSAFDKTKRLPEGVYRFTFEVLDYNRGTVVSSKITTTAWIILNDPPLLNLPRLNAKVSILDPVNIPFTWTPRHSASPNAAFTTEYIFRLVELPPGDYKNTNTAQMAANQAMLSQAPLLESVLTQSQLVYGVSEPALIPGRFYAWQVEARDTEGRDLFKNNGKSEVFVFQFGDALGTPLNLHSQGSTTSAISIRWELPSHGDMPEQYRISYQYNDKWYEAITKNRWFTIGNLQPDTRYPIKVRSEKGKQYSEHSSIITLNTLDASAAFQCGAKDGDYPIFTPEKPLFRLLPGDKLTMGPWHILVTEASGGNGHFNGIGYMSIPAFNGAGMKVKFHGKIDHFYVLDGESETIMTEGDNWAKDAVEVMEKIGEDRRKLEEQYQKEINLPVQLIIIGEIVAVVITPSGDIEIEKADGSKETIKHPLDEKTKEKEIIVLTDEKGNTYTVSKEGVVSNSGSTTSNTVAANVHYSVSFTKEETQQYGFDKKEHEVLDSYYKKENIQGLDYSIAWKSIAAGGIDKVKASASIARPDFAKEAAFKSDRGLLPKLPGSNNELMLTLQGSGHEEVETITAYLQKKDAEGKEVEETIGKLNLISYNKVNKTLVLVPVNETTLPIDAASLQQELNKIYGAAVVQWQVRVEPSLKSAYDIDNNGLEYGNSGLLSNYTTEMRTILNDYHKVQSLASDTYYLFLVPSASNKEVTGYMPRKKQAGFIFTNQLNGANLTKTIAHELAHGAFRLEHTFPQLPKNGTNLMDYSSTGTQLHKHQWDNIHDPVAVLGLFEGDEEGAMASLPCWGWFDDCDDILAILRGIKQRVETPGASLPLFKPDQSKNRGEKYEAFSLEIEGEEYSKIIIENEIKDDGTVDPRLYYDYNKSIGGDYFAGFMFKLDSTSLFKVLVAEESDSLTTHGKTEKLRSYLFGNIRPIASESENDEPDFPITLAQLTEIFPNTDEDILQEVVSAINELSDEFEINTRVRMSHLLGQIGTETGGLVHLREDPGYTAKNVYETFLKVTRGKLGGGTTYKYCDVIEGYDCTDLNGCPQGYSGPNRCGSELTFLSDASDAPVAYIVFDSTYNIKSSYINSASLFDYVYGCRMGNGAKTTLDGSTFLGKGFIHMTGKEKYERVSNAWNEKYPNDLKEFHGADINLLENDIAVAMKASLILWELDGLNEVADQGIDDSDIDDVGRIVNGSGTTLPNGYPLRRTLTKKAYDAFE